MIDSPLFNALAPLVRAVFPSYDFHGGKYRYRIVSMSVDRVNLQIVAKRRGLPDAFPVAMHPGLAGTWAQLALGGEVLLEFIEGDPTMPIITHFAPKGAPGFLPVHTTIDATSTVRLGETAEQVIVGADASTPLAVARAKGTGESLTALSVAVNAIIGVLTAGTPGVTPVLATAPLALPLVLGMTADPSTKLKAV